MAGRKRSYARKARDPNKPRRIVNRPEEIAQLAIVRFLRQALIPPDLFWATPNQRGTRSQFEQQLLVEMGLEEGVHDLFVLHRGASSHGLLIGLEVKRPPARLKSGAASKAKPKLSDSQKVFHPRFVAAGGVSFVVRSQEDVERALRSVGVPLRATVMAI